MNEKLRIYIKENLVKDNSFVGTYLKESLYDAELVCGKSNIRTYIDENKNENDFQQLLFKYIDDRNLKDSDVYNKVHIDRRLFSKIRSDNKYHPSKETIILLGLSLELNEKEIENLLESASYSLPKNNYYDLIIRFCFKEKIYKLDDINNMLDEYHCELFNY
jgi:hypothetical protein